jgi:hypothetical protein
MAENTHNKAPLEDLMVAMDVVDTLRHREKLIDRELDADARHERMIEELRDIYQRQGIEVTDAMLEEGVTALEEDRFAYSPTADSFSSKLAKVYISRDTWLKPVLWGLVVLLALWSFFYIAVIRPENALRAALPSSLEQRYESVATLALEEKTRWQADQIRQKGQLALSNEDYDSAQSAVTKLEVMLAQLDSIYDVRIINRRGEKSGILRLPDANRSAENYYLVVEAVDNTGKVLSLPISSEEDGSIKIVTKWGLRVSESVYKAVAADKQDDGIIQQRIVGQKRRGQLKPEYIVASDGAAITDW